MLHSDSIKNSREESHKRFIVTPIDKANKNVVVICKRFYALTLMKELGLRRNHTSTPITYQTCVDKTDNRLINSHDNIVLIHLNISLNGKNKRLLSIY